ncbi:MAG: acyl-CoA dehydrogenase family protein [Acidobacteria bacterium]|nr:acyl-CoA dehydrogenase family protein [Acidobacteriota bacterium]MBI3654932.1 acyl-CoA dehydrogenase family protein [Acidobacteriota bacterium]
MNIPALESTTAIKKGGSFLVEETAPEAIFTPEEFTEEHLMIRKTIEDFMENEVAPRIEEMEHKNFDVTVGLLRKAATLGLLAIDIPEKYGGLGLDKISSMVVAEKLTRVGSFAVSHGGHTGIGTWPILFFGTEEQKSKYLPKLATGELLAAYALTEPESGSDALGAKSTARLTADGKHYILNGTKAWITNAGFADIFIVFAKVNGEKFSCFLVEKDYPGVSTGKEEPKMGIEGSSTRTLILEDVPVPVENVIGQIGKGHKVAFNVLNLGRFKLGVGCIGGSKTAMGESIPYAIQRRQFGKPIASFGAIKNKIAEMSIRTWVGESMAYRTVGLANEALKGIDVDDSEHILSAIEEYAIECSILKVMGSEILSYVVDESVQIFGGYGYSREYPIERAYRDARINRIFEGTNEINRMLITGMVLKRAMKNTLPLIPAVQNLMAEIAEGRYTPEADDSYLGVEKAAVSRAKKALLLAAGAAVQKYMDSMDKQQEITSYLADMIMDIYAMESALLRTLKLVANQGEAKTSIQIDITRVFINDAMMRIENSAKQVLAAITEGEALGGQIAAMKRFTRYTPINTIQIKRRIADHMIEAGRYCG